MEKRKRIASILEYSDSKRAHGKAFNPKDDTKLQYFSDEDVSDEDFENSNEEEQFFSEIEELSIKLDNHRVSNRKSKKISLENNTSSTSLENLLEEFNKYIDNNKYANNKTLETAKLFKLFLYSYKYKVIDMAVISEKLKNFEDDEGTLILDFQLEVVENFKKYSKIYSYEFLNGNNQCNQWQQFLIENNFCEGTKKDKKSERDRINGGDFSTEDVNILQKIVDFRKEILTTLEILEKIEDLEKKIVNYNKLRSIYIKIFGIFKTNEQCHSSVEAPLKKNELLYSNDVLTDYYNHLVSESYRYLAALNRSFNKYY